MAKQSIDRARLEEAPEAFDAVDPAFDALAEQLRQAMPASSTDAAAGPSSGTDADGAPCRDEVGGTAELGRFRMIRVLGHGSFGIVLLAFDPRLQREVALKLPRPELLALGRWRRFVFHEARSAASLDHPGIVPIFDIGRVGAVWYIASAYCNGPTLSQWHRENGRVSTKVAAELVAQIADAVQHAHSRGILHRDLKPANVLLKLPTDAMDSVVPQALVTDFGLASRSPDSGGPTSRSGMAGTVAYMAPEQTFDDQTRVGTAADLYALGVILFELLTARLPFAADRDVELVELIRSVSAPPVRTIRNDVPRDLDAICAKCLAKEPTERYESAAALARDLRRFLDGECVEARQVGLADRAWRWCMRRPAMASLAAALLLAILVGATASFSQWQRAEKNLRQAEEAVVSLGWAIDDATFWHSQSDQYGVKQRDELTRHYVALLRQLSARTDAKPVQAAAYCFFARLDSLEREHDSARENFRRSISAWHELIESDPTNLVHRRALAKTLLWYGIFQLTNDQLADGMYHVEGDRLFGEFSGDDRIGQTVVFDYADILYEKAEAFREKNSDFEAAKYYSACIEICRRFMAAAPSDAEFRFRMLQSLVRLDAVHRPAASRERTYKTRTEVLDGLRALVFKSPDRNDYRLEHATVSAWLATHADSAGREVESDDYLDEAVKSFEVLSAKNDCPPEAMREYGDILRFKALRQFESGQRTAALQCAEESLRWHDFAELAGGNGALRHADTCYTVGGIYLNCGAEEEAIVTFERASKLYEAACGGAPRNRRVHLRHSDAWAKLAGLYESNGHTDMAIEASKKAISVLESWRGPEPEEPHVASQLRRLRSIVSRLQAADDARL
ncbi:MAG: serine/threonine protein kinase [Planctomycetes bacterium]|nr:serine/threonine protein kinase [Planctomycetota bacterium]